MFSSKKSKFVLILLAASLFSCGDTEKTQSANSLSRGTSGYRFFDESVLTSFRAQCSGCHLRGGMNGSIYLYENMLTYLGNGGSGADNGLVLKLRGQGGFNHAGGDQCPAGVISTPCRMISAWWDAEFNP